MAGSRINFEIYIYISVIWKTVNICEICINTVIIMFFIKLDYEIRGTTLVIFQELIGYSKYLKWRQHVNVRQISNLDNENKKRLTNYS